MKTLIAAAALLLPAALQAQMPDFKLVPIDEPADPAAVELWARATLTPLKVPERWGRLVADIGSQHMDARIVRNVSYPTITPVLPDPAKATGAAVVVAPGGAFLSLSMDSEGFDVAHWLADHGIAAFVLKYRPNETPADDQAFMAYVGRTMGAAIQSGGVAEIHDDFAAKDALRALKLIREGSAKWHVDPQRVGIIGFSAGAMTSLQSVLTGEAATRPSFFGYIYGPMIPVDVPAGAPPMFAALALDDPLFGRQGFGIVQAWQKAGRPVEVHAYEHGDHGFGMGRPGTTTTLVMDEFSLWLDTNGFLGSGARR